MLSRNRGLFLIAIITLVVVALFADVGLRGEFDVFDAHFSRGEYRRPSGRSSAFPPGAMPLISGKCLQRAEVPEGARAIARDDHVVE